MSLEWDQITYTTSKGLVLRAVGVEGHGLAIVRVVPVVTNAGLLQHIMIITLAWGTIIFLSSTFEGVVVVIAWCVFSRFCWWYPSLGLPPFSCFLAASCLHLFWTALSKKTHLEQANKFIHYHLMVPYLLMDKHSTILSRECIEDKESLFLPQINSWSAFRSSYSLQGPQNKL